MTLWGVAVGVGVAFGDQEADVWWKSEVKIPAFGASNKEGCNYKCFSNTGSVLMLEEQEHFQD